MISCSNTEGEEYLRQRRLQVPFNFTTGEGVLYNTGPTIDITEFQFNKMFSSDDVKKDTPPASLVDCFLRQDESAYSQPVERPLPVDQVFMESRALVSIPSDAWQENGAVATTGEPSVMKDEAKQSVMEVIDSLEKMAQNGDFSEALQNLEMDDAELIEWENALKRVSHEEGRRNDVRSDLDSILTNDIFDYIDAVLFKEKGQDSSPPSCLTAVNGSFAAAQLCEPQLFPTPSPEQAFSPMDAVFSHQQDTFASAQKLSHQGPLMAPADPGLPPLQQLQLQDIFSPSIELPELTLPEPFVPFPSCGQVPISHLGVSGQTRPGQHLLCPQPPAMAASGQLLQNSVEQPNNVAPGVMDILPPLIPCSDLSSSNAPNIPLAFATGCLQGAAPAQTDRQSQQVQQWQQSQQQKLQHAGVVQNGHELMPAAESHTFPHTGLWPRSVTRLNHAQQGGLACGQAASHNSCMFDQRFSSGPAGGDMLTVSGSSGLREGDAFADQTLLQGSCRFQRSHCEPAVGSSAMNQENGSVMFSREHALNIQHYLDNRQTQVRQTGVVSAALRMTQPSRDNSGTCCVQFVILSIQE